MAYHSQYTGAEVDALLGKVESGDVGGKVTVDSSLSTTSENPVMNKVITEGLNKKLEGEVIGVTSPTEGTIGGSYDDTEIRQEMAELSEEIEHQSIFIEDLQNTKIDRENDDYYPKMAVGLADNLAGVDVVDSEINFRRSGGGAISDGVARIESIKGNSVVWNQFSKNYTAYDSGWHHAEYSNQELVNYDTDANTLTISPGSGKTAAVAKLLCTFKSGHKILVSYGLELITNVERTGNPYIGYFGSPTQWLKSVSINDLTNKRVDYNIFVNLTSAATHIFLGLYGGLSEAYVDGDKVVVYTPRIIDLTQMFGAGNEPTTIEEFYARIPMGIDEYAYNEGEVIHMDVQSVESQGVNVWDEEWENGLLNSQGGNLVSATALRSKNYIRVLPNTTYFYRCAFNTGNGIAFYDKDKKFIAPLTGLTPNKAFATPSNCEYIRFDVSSLYGGVYNHDICINISDTSINGKYFPYTKRVEDLSIIRKYFPQGMKSAGTAHDEIRYNKATQKWEKVQRIGSVDMGTLNWAKSGTYTNGYYALPLSGAKPLQYPLCRLYSAVNVSSQQDKSIYVSNNGGQAQLFVIDSAYTDVASFKAAMAGVMLYYELAEPIVTELDEADQFKDLDYQVWNAGTEKAIAEGKSAPLAADITYGFNAIGKIKELESLVAALRSKVGI